MSYDPDNVFAKILRGELPATKVYEDETTLAFMDIFPRAPGHALVIPKAPARNLLDIAPDSLADLIRKTQIVARAVKQALNADGFMIQQFNEAPGGQVVFHIHFHIVPRWEGVAVLPPGVAGNKAEIEANAEKIRAALA